MNPENIREINRRYYLKHRERLIFEQMCMNAGVKREDRTGRE